MLIFFSFPLPHYGHNCSFRPLVSSFSFTYIHFLCQTIAFLFTHRFLVFLLLLLLCYLALFTDLMDFQLILFLFILNEYKYARLRSFAFSTFQWSFSQNHFYCFCCCCFSSLASLFLLCVARKCMQIDRLVDSMGQSTYRNTVRPRKLKPRKLEFLRN